MKTKQTKQKIIETGAAIIHKKGFNNTGIKEILDMAAVPKGSFYHYFKSKEDFGLALIDYYSRDFIMHAEETYRDTGHPLRRLKKLFDRFLDLFSKNGCELGCPIGNLSQEMGDLNPAFREKLHDIFLIIRSHIVAFLDEARQMGYLSKSVNAIEMADFIINCWEGAILRMKADKSTQPLILFDRMVFGKLLKSPPKISSTKSELLF